MPNQRAIAKELGLTQATVSMALRNVRSIPEATRERVRQKAEEMGYKPSPQVSTLMERIRSGREIKDHSCIGIIVDASSEKDWLIQGGDTYRLQYEGYKTRAAMRGYRTECFFLKGPGMSAAAVDRQLYARGIEGVILAAPRSNSSDPTILQWERYALSTVSYSWSSPLVDRISSHHRHAMDQAFSQALARGYRRIGFCLPENASLGGVDANWMAGYLIAQMQLPRSRCLPAFIGAPMTTELKSFQKWYERWKPDVLVSLIGEERVWIEQMGLDFPKELAIVCLNCPTDSDYSGINENNRFVGETVADHVINLVTRNERGLPEFPKVILTEGYWQEGTSLP
ncbi:LacI family DNA-binding transcriptional regulator [Coraliomargarita algicola]|uniref:LacI family DNA-binding transcriptional regulator n=1 Tax=Coraliomargarita algicola TaxID=3092156 RepID=A0ABZ0RL02_9BACT|nr:LacI family DNA-binding transcriptional regulator [Coraliomargarita sp. J2-16]WPJ96123.1 LacI family DNA-binding transcriptional regulator [Coraliomargarita sp. J2-16]